MTKLKLILLVSLLLAACAHVPHNQAVQPDAEDQSTQADQPEETELPPETQPAEVPPAEAPPAQAPMVLPDIELSSDLLYEFLLSEIAAQRGDGSVAVESSLDLAKNPRPPPRDACHGSGAQIRPA